MGQPPQQSPIPGQQQAYAPVEHQQAYQPTQQQAYYEPQQQPVHAPQQHQQPAYHEPQTQVYAQGHNVHNQDWQNGICNCSPCSSCLLATCLPCMLFGRTQSRMRDPSMTSHQEVNSECGLWCGIQFFTGCGWIYTMLKRGEIREQYGIKGSGFNDCCISYWCGCCALIQQDNEVKARTARGPITQGYQQQKEGMHMPGQPQHHPPGY